MAQGLIEGTLHNANSHRKHFETGTYVTTIVTGKPVQAFIPSKLTPNPPVELAGLYPHLDRTNQALGRLDGLTTLLPDNKFLLDQDAA